MVFRWLFFAAMMAGGLFSGKQLLAAEAAPSFFNSVETQSSNLSVFKKWTGALDRYSKETAEKKGGDCKETSFNKCHYDRWMSFLKGIEGKDQMAKISEVNRVMNKSKYIQDIDNWGVSDYWESPGEFLTRSGDCEDFAIIKYISLKNLGFKAEQMRVAAVNDLNLKTGHAVLVVYLDGKIYVLDNQINAVAEASSIRHYQPVFSINDQFWWRHRDK